MEVMEMGVEVGGYLVVLSTLFLHVGWCLFGEYPGYPLHLIDIILSVFPSHLSSFVFRVCICKSRPWMPEAPAPPSAAEEIFK